MRNSWECTSDHHLLWKASSLAHPVVITSGIPFLPYFEFHRRLQAFSHVVSIDLIFLYSDTVWRNIASNMSYAITSHIYNSVVTLISHFAFCSFLKCVKLSAMTDHISTSYRRTAHKKTKPNNCNRPRPVKEAVLVQDTGMKFVWTYREQCAELRGSRIVFWDFSGQPNCLDIDHVILSQIAHGIVPSGLAYS